MITQDLRYGWRQIARRPGFAAVAALTLGLGIGANVSMFSFVDRRLREQIPGVEHVERFFSLNGTSRTRTDLNTSYPDFVDLRQRRPSGVEDLLAYILAPMNMRTDGDPQRVFGEIVSGNYFDVLGVHTPLGRTFLPDEDTAPNRHPVVVLSHNFWQRRFAGDPTIVGRVITLNGRAFTVIGVAPPGFHGTAPYLNIDMWVPMMMQPAVNGSSLTARGNHWLEVLVKVRPGVGRQRAEADLGLIARDLAAADADANQGVVLYELWRAPSFGGVAVTAVMGVQLAVAGAVLLIACANVANLLIANAATRQRETAVRLTLGASRARLVQQLLTESTLLAAMGGVVGIAVAYLMKDVGRLFIPPAPLPIEMTSRFSGAMLMFAIAVTTVTAFVFGLVPAIQASGWSVMSALKESATAVTAAPQRARLRKALVVVQVALSLLLLVSAGLFLRTLAKAQAVDPGFSTRTGLVASIDLQPAGYDAARGSVFQQQLLTRVREIPGVGAATFARRMPLGFGGNANTSISVDGYTPGPNEEVNAYFNVVGSDYLRTMGIGLVAGRDFTDRDAASTPHVLIINETMARRYFGGRDPLGGRVRIGTRALEVVGVARDGKYGSLTEAPRVFMYLPLQQWYRSDAVLIVKTHGDPSPIAQPLHAAVRSLDADVPLFDIRTIAEYLEVGVFLQRMIASILGAFGMLALLLATVGLYGVIAAIASQRTQEIGMRMALGARTIDIVTLIVRQGLSVVGLGVAIGLLAAFSATRLFKGLLVGVSATDTATFAGTTALLVAVALAATYLPARRAAALDPAAALRSE